MKQITKTTLLLLFIVSVLATTSCSSSKRGQCGCPNRQGMIGYK